MCVNFSNFRCSNIDEVKFKSDYIIFDQPKKFIKFFVPHIIYNRRLQEGITTAYITIMGLMERFIYLNPDVRPETLKEIMQVLNYQCTKKISSEVLIEMYEELLFLIDSNQINPKANDTRTFLVNPKLTKSKKLKAIGKITGIIRKRNTKQKLSSIINTWNDGKFSNKKLAEKSGLALKTIKKYTPLLKEQITVLKNKTPQRKPNDTLQVIISAMLKFDLKNGLPKYKDLSLVTGLSVDTIKKYGKHLKETKELLKRKQELLKKEYDYFTPFDGILNATNTLAA